MNLEYERADEAGAEPAPVEAPVVFSELLSEEEAAAVTDPKVFEQQLAVIDRLCQEVRPTDPLSMKQAAAIVVTATYAARFAEAQRTAIVEPHNKAVKEANAIWQPIVKGLQERVRAKGAELSAYIETQRRLAAQAQQKALEDARRAQEEKERKEREAREEAERLRREAEQAGAAEAKALLKKADKLEARAAVSEVTPVAVPVVPMQETKLDLGGVTFSAKAPKKTWVLAGWDKAKPLRLTDPRLAELLGDLSALPAGVRFLVQHADLNPVYLNKAFGVVPFPAPFGEAEEFKGASVRGGKA